jgi:hypothetical protein
MDYTEKDLKKKLKAELEEMAKKVEGFQAKRYKKKEDLIAFLLKKEVLPSKKDLLLEKASKYVDFKKKVHGASIAKLEAFLASKEATPTAATVAVVETTATTDLSKLSLQELRKMAKTHGWNKRTGTKVELVAFLRDKMQGRAVPEGRLADSAVAVVETEAVEGDLEEWPVRPEVLAKHSKTVDDLKRLLKAKGVAVGLPRTKKEILELFQKSRCSFKDFACSDTEFCDLRNNLCRGLNILRNKDNEIKKLAKGLVYLDEEKGRFYGTPEAIARVRQLLVPEIGTTTTTPPPVATQVVVQEETKQEKPHDEEQEGISPININRLLDKPSENEIRRAILHCLGLYHDIDPNDEIILRPT